MIFRVIAAGLALAACSSDSKHSPADASERHDAAPVDGRAHDAAPVFHDAPTGSPLSLVVPASYTGAPRELAIVGTAAVPISGPPSTVFLTDMMPAPAAGQTMHLQLDASSANGDLYVVAVLYQVGGGQFSPKSGVDYVAQSATRLHFTGAPIDFGTLDLALAP